MRPLALLPLCLAAAFVPVTVRAAEARVVSPEIAADRHVTFRLAAPNAHEVVLSGEFMREKLPLKKDETGVWSVTVGPIAPEIYCYSFSVDGVHTIDGSNPSLKTGSVAATLESLLEVPAPQPAFYDGQAVPHGEVRTLWYDSKALGTQRRVLVYVPPGYDDAARRGETYPVLYLLHGARADETAWVKLGRANLILDNLLAANAARPFIVVMPFGYGVDPNGPGPHDQNTVQFSRDLLTDVMPLVEARFRTVPDRDHRALIGLSMGGGEAFSIGLNHLERFSYVAGFSAGIGRPAGYPQTFASLIADPATANKQLKLLWIGCGTEDASHLSDARAFSALLREHGVKHTLVETPGAHTWIVWREYLREVAPMLFR
jgi:enterochelin esterase-like enzyme